MEGDLERKKERLEREGGEREREVPEVVLVSFVFGAR